VSAILLATLPIFLLIFLGALFRRSGFLGEAFWEAAERLTYFVLFPALLVATLANADLAALDAAPMAAAIAASLLLMSALLLALRPWLRVDGPAFTSVVQGVLRQNTYIGLAASLALFGRVGLAAAAIAVATIVPLVNVLSVAALQRYGRTHKPSMRGALRALARNPLILGSLLGLALNASGLGLPPIVAPMLDILGRGALAIGLLAVGAGLDFAALRESRRVIGVTAALRLLAMPALTALVCLILGVAAIPATVAVLFNGLPTAVNAYILARQLGGDAPLMAGMITAQTALAMLSLPFVLALFALVAPA